MIDASKQLSAETTSTIYYSRDIADVCIVANVCCHVMIRFTRCHEVAEMYAFGKTRFDVI